MILEIVRAQWLIPFFVNVQTTKLIIGFLEMERKLKW
jgi:hypothetical protein